MVKKVPRRTAERILEMAQELFNRFGEPHVSTTMLSAELGISPGNLYYHFPAKDDLVHALLDRHEADLAALLPSAGRACEPEDAWRFVHALAEAIWSCRFLYRDPGELLSRNRRIEERLQQLLARREQAFCTLLTRLGDSGALQLAPADIPPVALNLTVLLSGWVSHAAVRAPRQAMEPEATLAQVTQAAQQAVRLLLPYLDVATQARWRERLCPAVPRPAPAPGLPQPETVH